MKRWVIFSSYFKSLPLGGDLREAYNQPFHLQKKRRSPALIYFVLGCQRRVALPAQTKYPTRIDILVDNHSYLTLFERSLRVRLKIKNSPAFKL